MKKEYIKNILAVAGEDLIAIYMYQQTHKDRIPIFVLRDIDLQQLATIKKVFREKHFIILSQEDITEGADVFALKFLHMKNHTELVQGKDVLADIHLQKEDVRSDLEREIRQKSIQLREYYLSYKGSIYALMRSVQDAMLNVWEGIFFLYNKDLPEGHTHDAEFVARIVKEIEQLCSCKGDVFEQILREKKIPADQIPVTINGVHKYLTEIGKIVNDVQV